MKELPYFRFTVQEWQNGDVQFHSYHVKGLFIDICGFYWLRDCSIARDLLELRFIKEKNSLDLLFQYEILKEDKNGFVVIDFLNEQYDLLSNKRKKRQKAGKKGGKQKSSNAKAKTKQNSSYKDNDKEKDNIKEIVSFFNSQIGTSYKPDTESTKKRIRARMKEGFTVENFKAVIINRRDAWISDPKMREYLRPETLFGTKFEGYLNESKVITEDEGRPF